MALLLDASVLIQAARYKYPFDLAPGFWSSLAAAGDEGLIRVNHYVANVEILPSDDELAKWLKDQKNIIEDDRSPQTSREFDPLRVALAARTPSYRHSAIDEFFDCGDSWVVAHAKANGHEVVHEETSGQMGIKRVKMPDACDLVGVRHLPTLDMMRRLKFKLQ
ncbi:MAG: DUF4411 family protein [Nannocystis sp.]|nr:DUF4411 family protein [Nannocystis sp.]